MKAKVSVIVPVYNVEKYLKTCIDTIFSQTLDEIEVICINDGSTDNSLNILKDCAVIYGNLKLIDQENHGVGYARNRGIDAATGEFIAFMDPDDYYLEKNTLELLYNKAKENNVKICGGSLSEDHDDGRWIRKNFEGIYTKYTFEKEALIKYSDYQFDFGFYRFIYNREFLINNNIYFPEYIRFQDPPFFVKAMIEAGEFYAVKDYTYCYRYGHQQLVWHEKRVCDFLRGHIDDLRLSKEAGLKDLHLLTLHRIVNIGKNMIGAGLEQRSVEMINLLIEAQSCLCQEWIEGTDYTSVYDAIFNAYVAATEEKLIYDAKEKKITKKCKKLENDNKLLQKEITKLKSQNKAVKSSITFKIGKVIMFIPHNIKRLFKK